MSLVFGMAVVIQARKINKIFHLSESRSKASERSFKTCLQRDGSQRNTVGHLVLHTLMFPFRDLDLPSGRFSVKGIL
jgi:hypothetical protein